MAEYDGEVRVGTRVDTREMKNTQKEFNRLTKKVESLKATLEGLEAAGWDQDSDHWRRVAIDVANTEAELQNVTARLMEFHDMDDISDGFSEAEEAARNFTDTVQEGAEDANHALQEQTLLLKALGKTLIVFTLLAKGFKAMASAAKAGFKNLEQSESEYSAALASLRSECAQLKNALAAAFEPIVTTAIPYLTQLVSWLNKVIDVVGQFIAALTGKSTYIKAKKQVVDYAKGLDTAKKAAKGALAAFDELNVISQDDGTGSEVQTGGDAFEEVAIDDSILIAAEKVKKILEEIAPYVDEIAMGLAAWKISELLGGGLVAFIGVLAVIAGLVLLVTSYFNMWENGVDWEGIQGYLLGVALVVGGLFLLFGPIAAGLALIVAGVAAVVLAIKDMNENGVTAENVVLLIIGAVGILVGVFLLFGGTVTLVVAAVMAFIAIIAAVVAWAGNGEECLATLKAGFQALGDFIGHVFAGDFEAAFEDIKNILKHFVNFTIIIAESFINVLIKGINWLIEKINTISFEVPEWVPVIGGNEMGFNLPSIKEVKLPRLANGAVIQGGRPFAAILGDQPWGQTNIETPLRTMVDAFKQAMNETGGNNSSYTFIAQLNGKTLFKETVRQNQMHIKATGKSAMG